MPYYDEVFKHLADTFSQEFAALALNTPDVEVLERLSTEQPTVKMHHSDLTFKVSLPEEEAILHIEIQTDDSRDKPMPLRVLAYTSFLVLQHEISVYSTVIYLRRPAGQNDPGHYSYGTTEHAGLWIRYPVIKLYELEGQPFLDRAAVGLLPFTPLMKPPPGLDAENWIQRCVSTTLSVGVDNQTRATLLFALSLFGSLAHNPEFFEDLITEEIMQESPFYERVMQRGIEQGIEQGETLAKREALLKLLHFRFDVVPESITNQIHAIRSLGHLDSLFEKVLTAKTLDAIDWKPREN